MTKDLLMKFIENRCSSDELEQVVYWIDKEATFDKGKDLVNDDWNSFEEEKYSFDQNNRFNLLLDKIHHKININQLTGSKNQQLRSSSKITIWMTKAAAILLIPVLSFLIYTLSSNSINREKYADTAIDSLEVIAPIGSRTVAKLSDGTEVHLNSGSKIKYPRNFHNGIREINLSGEGFFDVVHDPEHPFIVKTKHINIKALGTKFNVHSYSENDVVATTLIDGKVVLEKLTGKEKTIGTMVPGQHIEYHVNSGEISSTKGNVEKYIAWKDGLLFFDNSSIDEVAERLERMFNVNIETTNQIKDFTYTVKFVDESLPQILDLLSKATPLEYTFIPREKMTDGTYSKQKILLKKK